MSESALSQPRRGRPPKYGRPAQLVTLTLPDDALAWLKTIHPDPAWAVVKLHERAHRRPGREMALAELAQLPGRRALILVNTDAFRALPGVAIIPLADGRGFLALESGRGIADLEIAVIDRLDGAAIGAPERNALEALRSKLKQWRQDGVRFESRSIVVAHRGPRENAPPQPLTELRSNRKPRDAA